MRQWKARKKKQTKKSFNSRGNCSSNIYLGFLYRRVGWAIAIITELFNSLNFFWSFVWTQVSAFNRRKLLRTGKWHAELTHLSRFRGLSVTSYKHEHKIMTVRKAETSDPKDRNKPWTIIKNIPVSRSAGHFVPPFRAVREYHNFLRSRNVNRRICISAIVCGRKTFN